MIQAKCIQKFRDKNNKIYGYRLQDINGQTQDVKPENLKQAIINKQIHVANLTLTSDNRLVDTTEKQLKSKKLGEEPKQPKHKNKTKFMKICDILGFQYDENDAEVNMSFEKKILGINMYIMDNSVNLGLSSNNDKYWFEAYAPIKDMIHFISNINHDDKYWKEHPADFLKCIYELTLLPSFDCGDFTEAFYARDILDIAEECGIKQEVIDEIQRRVDKLISTNIINTQVINKINSIIEEESNVHPGGPWETITINTIILYLAITSDKSILDSIEENADTLGIFKSMEEVSKFIRFK